MRYKYFQFGRLPFCILHFRFSLSIMVVNDGLIEMFVHENGGLAIWDFDSIMSVSRIIPEFVLSTTLDKLFVSLQQATAPPGVSQQLVVTIQ